mmetsp:Transcript_27248/g.19659  ORF Transcript_27248/g.19659 Transcript_27248/m.19659 type:complete len:175 (-) Transcript_27248:169-693(-)|eukprot:CAMPEP_0116880470 /NCGR_PEP_ID=MMETSP0463-20121206/12407_1 /TAXON_ID=181622 /ORGANISM="Strombidinopsis sp, Strain SopsisLIS2011" /LENGTH=174 /DNA_ID=CAMNT_0004531097 /DNA_START=700 /DNA_END=1224 /DNA_ORIENTATION=+
MTDDRLLVWLEIDPDSMFWETTVTGVRFGESNFRDAYKIEEVRAVFDSATAYIALPASLYDKLIDKLFFDNGILIEPDKNGNLKVDCSDSNYKNFYLFIQGHWVQVRPQDYLLKSVDTSQHQVCYLAFYKNLDEYFILGDPVYKGYYMIHEVEKNELGIVPYSTSYKKYLVADT